MKQRRHLLCLHILTMAMTLLVVPFDDKRAAHAADVSGDWPRIGRLVAQPAQGQWIKYHQSRTLNGKTQSAYIWQIIEKVENGQLQIANIAATQSLSPQPPRKDAPGVKTQAATLKLQDPLPGLPIPPVAKIVRDQTTRRAYSHLPAGDAIYSGTQYTRRIQMTMPGNAALTYTINLWISPEAPVTGIVRQEARVSGAYNTTMSMEVVTSSITQAKLRAVAQADAKAYAIPTIGKPSDILDYSEKLAFRAWRLDSLGRPEQSRSSSLVDAFHGEFALSALEIGDLPRALKARHRILNYRRNAYVTQAFERYLSLHGTRADMLKFGASPTRVDAIRLQHIVDDQAPGAAYTFDAYLKQVTDQKDPALRRIALVGGLKNRELTLDQRRQLVSLFLDKRHHQLWFQNACRDAAARDDLRALEYLPALSPSSHDPWHAISLATVYCKQDDRDRLKPALDQAIIVTTQAMGPSSELSAVGQIQAREALVKLLKEARDPRYLAHEKTIYEERFASIQKQVAKDPQVAHKRYMAPNLAAAAAIAGDKDKAIAIITAMEGYEPSQMVPVLVLYYAHSTDKQSANDWWLQLKGDEALLAQGQTFRTFDLKAEAALGFAEHHRAMGDQGGNDKWLDVPNYDKWLDIAIDQAVIAHVQLVAYNKTRASGQRAFWRTGGSLIDDAPYQSVAKHLLEHPSPDNDARLLKLLMQLKNEMPASGKAGDAWGDTILALAKAGRRDRVGALLKALPRDWQNNWYTDILSRATASVAAIEEDDEGNVAYVRQLVAMQVKPSWKAEVLRAAIIALADRDRILDAQALMADMKKVVSQDKAWPKHQSFATVAIAKALASRGLLDRALVAFNDREMNLDEGIAIRGFNGRNWVRYLEDIGRQVGRFAASADSNNHGRYDTVTTWSNAIADKRELAVILLGMARSYDDNEQGQ